MATEDTDLSASLAATARRLVAEVGSLSDLGVAWRREAARGVGLSVAAGWWHGVFYDPRSLSPRARARAEAGISLELPDDELDDHLDRHWCVDDRVLIKEVLAARPVFHAPAGDTMMSGEVWVSAVDGADGHVWFINGPGAGEWFGDDTVWQGHRVGDAAGEERALRGVLEEFAWAFGAVSVPAHPRLEHEAVVDHGSWWEEARCIEDGAEALVGRHGASIADGLGVPLDDVAAALGRLAARRPDLPADAAVVQALAGRLAPRPSQLPPNCIYAPSVLL